MRRTFALDRSIASARLYITALGLYEAHLNGQRVGDELVVLEQNEAWDHPGIALALAIWLVAGLVLTSLTFRWIRKDS